MKNNIKVHIRPVRTLSYLILLAANIFFLFFLRNYIWLLMTGVFVLFPIVSFVGVCITFGSICLTLGAGRNQCVCGEIVPMELRMYNKKWYPVLDSRIIWETTNHFLEDRDEVVISMPVRIHGETMLRLPLEINHPGRFTFCVKQLEMQDLLGLVRVGREVLMEKEMTVFPQSESQDDMDITEFLAGAMELEESNKKGHDYAEVSDIRQFIPGDRIRDIHWKLTAKEGELMVKDRVSMAGSEMVLVLTLREDKEETRHILQCAMGVCERFMAMRQPMRILCWNKERRAYDSYRFLEEAERNQALAEFFRVPLRARLGDGDMAYLKQGYPFLNQCLVIHVEKGSYRAEMRNV